MKVIEKENELEHCRKTSQLQKISTDEIFRLPACVSIQVYNTVLPLFPLWYNSWLSADSFTFWQHMFCFGWFSWLVAYKHSGCLCSQWDYKFPTSNPLSMVCDNVYTISYYTNTCNSSNNSKKQDSSKFVQLTYKCCLLCRICKVGKLA